MKCVGCECELSRCQNKVTKVGSLLQNPITHTELTEEVDGRRDEGMRNGTEDGDGDGRAEFSDFRHLCTSGDERYDKEVMLYFLDKYF